MNLDIDLRSTLKTGDILLFKSSNPTGFFLKTFTSSEWNHVGIAIRLIDNRKISLTEEGNLFVLETNTGTRPDILEGKNIVGAGFSDSNWVFNNYNKVAVRRLKDIFRNNSLIKRTEAFVKKYRGIEFPDDLIPFLSVWLGLPLTSKNIQSTAQEGMFCSELTTHYYKFCLGPEYQSKTGTEFDDIRKLFGYNAPIREDLYAPKHYSYLETPNATFFDGPEEVIYGSNADLFFTIIQPLILILFFCVILIMILPKK